MTISVVFPSRGSNAAQTAIFIPKMKRHTELLSFLFCTILSFAFLVVVVLAVVTDVNVDIVVGVAVVVVFL